MAVFSPFFEIRVGVKILKSWRKEGPVPSACRVAGNTRTSQKLNGSKMNPLLTFASA